jgi:uncharacterized protein (DUF2384 family)
MLKRVQRHMIDNPRVAAQWLLKELYPLTGEKLTAIVGTDEAALSAFTESGEESKGLDQARLVLVAQLVFDLRDSRDTDGVIHWFERPRHQLGERAPVELLADDAESASNPLRSLARGSRGQLAT